MRTGMLRWQRTLEVERRGSTGLGVLARTARAKEVATQWSRKEHGRVGLAGRLLGARWHDALARVVAAMETATAWKVHGREGQRCGAEQWV